MKIYREVENIPEPTEEELEAAKHGRIYATRAESALVGENVPIRTKDEPKAEDKPETPSAGASDGNTPTFEATVSDEGASSTSTGNGAYTGSNPYGENGYQPRDYNPQGSQSLWGNEGGSDSDDDKPANTGGGRFSHVPDDFDKK